MTSIYPEFRHRFDWLLYSTSCIISTIIFVEVKMADRLMFLRTVSIGSGAWILDRLTSLVRNVSDRIADASPRGLRGTWHEVAVFEGYGKHDVFLCCSPPHPRPPPPRPVSQWHTQYTPCHQPWVEHSHEVSGSHGKAQSRSPGHIKQKQDYWKSCYGGLQERHIRNFELKFELKSGA